MNTSTAENSCLSDFVDACREQGIKATHQRVEILRVLAGSEEHPDAESVYDRVRERVPSISLDTVYRTLRFFEEHGIIARVGSVKSRARYDANRDRHHHFVCTKCGLVRDFYSEQLDRMKPPPDINTIGKVNAVYVELRGVCRKCRKEKVK
jgi:Fur family peroxide stress response transcriptional regulator